MAHRESIDDFLTNRPITGLSAIEWEKLKILCALLKPCKEASDQLGGERYVSASVVLPHIAHLLHTMRASDDDPAYVARFKLSFHDDLVERRAALTETMFLKTASALDPRFKKLKCVPHDECELVWSHVLGLMEQELGRADDPQDDAAAAAPKRSRYHCDNDDEDDHDGATRPTAMQMLQLYRCQPRASDDTDPLAWWKDNVNAFGPMSQLALRFLCCLGTRVPSERLFSRAGNVISKKRSSLLPENANKLICLASWL